MSCGSISRFVSGSIPSYYCILKNIIELPLIPNMHEIFVAEHETTDNQSIDIHLNSHNKY